MSASDDLTIGSSLRNLGIGLLTAVSNGAHLSFNNNSITNAKLLNLIITLGGQAMNLDSSYITPLLAITNAMLAGNIALSKLASGTSDNSSKCIRKCNI